MDEEPPGTISKHLYWHEMLDTRGLFKLFGTCVMKSAERMTAVMFIIDVDITLTWNTCIVTGLIVSYVKHVLICSSSRIELGDVTPHNIKQLKRLNQVIFPVSYNDKFYKDVLEVGELAKLAYFNDIAVGAVCCRVDHSQNQKRLYIMTLGCLAPYRRLGIGTKMLNHVLNICEKDGTFDNIYLHVQISNESAIDFYRKFGFEIIETKKNYYKRIEPADAHVLQKNLKAPCLGQNADVQKTDN
ncbi:PREDICTED: N-alpha-acetyltransferase 50 [Buceros rhinoceros silvestris]|uniref:N-alpha-acetyltransferase 50 n=1 Tax=Buceros rhinoceros silvestris TaxID=175836 RepID=UPI0005284DE9|nr:PREDICTED: N-alpha-acetyltransferase 50 [Buceros rhinoceros silvestris]